MDHGHYILIHFLGIAPTLMSHPGPSLDHESLDVSVEVGVVVISWPYATPATPFWARARLANGKAIYKAIYSKSTTH
jgi:hypothetical protein